MLQFNVQIFKNKFDEKRNNLLLTFIFLLNATLGKASQDVADSLCICLFLFLKHSLWVSSLSLRKSLCSLKLLIRPSKKSWTTTISARVPTSWSPSHPSQANKRLTLLSAIMLATYVVFLVYYFLQCLLKRCYLDSALVFDMNTTGCSLKIFIGTI